MALDGSGLPETRDDGAVLVPGCLLVDWHLRC